MPDRLVPFLLVVAVLTVTPGPDMALVLRNGVRGGPIAALQTGLGCCAGIAMRPLSGGQAFRQGLLTNLLNPKIAALFLTLIPQFVSAGEPKLRTTAVLAGLFLVIAVAWWGVFSLGIRFLGQLLSRDRVVRALDRITGAVLLGLGLRVALSN